ncbi:hypothetical protein [Microbulbifer litoralis]|uniref:hypothetical protein n=1 Tax=Microbulbifer litoralis TaxID=2933965 RepID=UPI0020289CDD|nr:hypothetical protein [Microbulbifer sp. GX H0434]
MDILKTIVNRACAFMLIPGLMASALLLTFSPADVRAQVLPTQVTCTGLQTLSYSPGLTYEQQNVDIELQANLICVSISNPTIISAARSLEATLSRSCNDLLNGGSLVVDTTWNTGETSEETVNYTVTYSGGQLTLVGQGSITQGKFLGSVTTDTMNLVGDINACNTEDGLTSLNGPVTFNVLL